MLLLLLFIFIILYSSNSNVFVFLFQPIDLVARPRGYGGRTVDSTRTIPQLTDPKNVIYQYIAFEDVRNYGFQCDTDTVESDKRMMEPTET